MATNYYRVGNYAADAEKAPFIDERPLVIYCSGLRPSTQVNVFFDGKNVNAYTRAAKISGDATLASSFYPISDFGGPAGGLKTNQSGEFAAIFYIPANTFFVGEREVVVADVANYSNLSNSTTSAKAVFKSFLYDPDATDPSLVSFKPSDSSTDTTSLRGNGAQQTPTKPLSFKFFVGSDDTQGQDGLYITAFDLYFQSKSVDKGIVFDLRTVDNGVPSGIVIPNSRVRLAPSSVNISADSSVATKISFNSPIYVRAGFEYALTINPEGGSPDYKIWSSEVGEVDFNTGSVVSKQWGEGALYTETNDLNWMRLDNEYIKFKIYRAQFGSSGTINLTNRDYEFLAIANNAAAFRQGEYVFQDTSNATGTISCNTTSHVVIGTGTSFYSTLAPGNRIVLANNTVSDVVTIDTVANNTYLTVKEYPRVFTTNGNYKRAVTGKVVSYNPYYYRLVLDESSAANSTFCFTTGSTVKGVLSNATATVSGVLNTTINKFTPLISASVPHATASSLTLSGLKSNYTQYTAKTYNMNGESHITDAELIVASKTNEILYNSNNKSLSVSVNLQSTNEYQSPIIDLQDSSLYTSRTLINDSSYEENKNTGLAHSKYISKRVTLREDLDAEDIAVYIAAYRPPGTDIEIYAKILNTSDSEDFGSKDWSILDIDDPNLYSDVNNRTSFKEYKYSFTKSPASYPKPGVLSVNNSSTTVTGTGARFAETLVTGDVIKIFESPTSNNFGLARVTSNKIAATGTLTVNTTSTAVVGTGTTFTTQASGFVPGAALYVGSNNRFIGIVNNVVSPTSLFLTANGQVAVTTNTFYNDSLITIDTPMPFNSNTAVYERVTYTNAAFKNPQNTGIVRYYSASGAAYDSYRTFAIKIVLKSNTSYLVPRVLDVRVIAMSV